jgi:23S rRNA (guanosine2251-2'-O)-methyltransferase
MSNDRRGGQRGSNSSGNSAGNRAGNSAGNRAGNNSGRGGYRDGGRKGSNEQRGDFSDRGRGRDSDGFDDYSSQPPERERGLGGDQVEGVNAVRELLRADRRDVKELLISVGRENSPAIEEIIELAREQRVRVREVGATQMEAVARSESPQGVIALASSIEPVEIDALLEDPRAFIVVLDGVTDPGNLGAVMRTAEQAGATGFVLPKHRSARLTPSAMKAAAGAAEWLPIAQTSGVPSFLERAKRAGVWSVGLDADGDVDVNEIPVADAPLVIVLGAEGSGLSRLTRGRCDLIASIPTFGHLDSLNVSAAAAVACFAVARRRGQE